ncbi:MAG: MarR family winged helix-turn-helix transcriptional regulator [Acidimicrobiales bacterium]|jgi:DNA-binding MarR family transcriptional regulator
MQEPDQQNNTALSSADLHNPAEKMLDAERDVQARLGDRPIDFEANRAISNIYRAAASVRRQAERGLLKDYGLSWGGFTILWVLWVWGEMETASLATECDLAKGTLTGMLTTLEKRDLVERSRSKTDGRRVLVSATGTGVDMIDELFPKFNQLETGLVSGLSNDESMELSRLLRLVITNSSPTED